jgi:hypothetical protein
MRWVRGMLWKPGKMTSRGEGERTISEAGSASGSDDASFLECRGELGKCLEGRIRAGVLSTKCKKQIQMYQLIRSDDQDSIQAYLIM